MTNTHSIEELKNIETALSNLVQLSQGNDKFGGLIQLIHKRFQDCQSDIITSLVIQDIEMAEREGGSFTDQQKALLVQGSITTDQVISSKIKLAS